MRRLTSPTRHFTFHTHGRRRPIFPTYELLHTLSSAYLGSLILPVLDLPRIVKPQTNKYHPLLAENQWLHLPLITQLKKDCGDVFPVAEYAYTTIPSYPSGQIGFMV